MIVGTAGHIDHGKTSLIRALTGIDTDRLPQEKARGITLDLGFAYMPLPNGGVLGFVDVPGHERLVHTMIAGATSIGMALLVVAAADGVMPQTREHLQIAALLEGTPLAGAEVFPVSVVTGAGTAAAGSARAAAPWRSPAAARGRGDRRGRDRAAPAVQGVLAAGTGHGDGAGSFLPA